MDATQPGNGMLVVDGTRPELRNGPTWIFSSVGSHCYTYVSELYGELDIIAQDQFVDVALVLAVVEEDLPDDV